jgi:hypothetical protein
MKYSSGFSVGDPPDVAREPPRVPGPDSRMVLAVVGVAPAASGAATQAKGRECRPPEATQPMTGIPGVWCTGGVPQDVGATHGKPGR